MPDSDFIPRERPDPDNLEYAALKRQGIALNQDLSGDTWTDYNEHDPGVTILEQLCYGLTDLAYRSGLPVPDYLCDGKGNIDYAGQALFRPQDILPSRPVTANDYRKLLYDAVPEIEDVWLKPKRGKGAHVNGLYTVYVKLDNHQLGAANQDARKAEVRDKVMRIFSANRNLCEDIDEIKIVDTAKYYLSGVIEVKGGTPAKVFADIFFQCARLLSSAIRIERYEDVLAAGMGYERVFNGPLTTHGFIDDAGFAEPHKTISSVKLIGLIRQIEGVAQVRNFVLRDESGNAVDDVSCDPGQSGFPDLAFPDTEERKHYLQFAVSRGARRGNSPAMLAQEADSKKQDAMLDAARLELKKLYFGFRAFRSAGDSVGRLIKMPHGMPHDLADYYSIQNQFPAIYGINRYGIPKSATKERKAQGKQLKAYLYPFEQIMANYLQTLDGISRVFSLEEELQQTYFSQALGNAQIPDIERLRDADTPAAYLHDVAEICDDYDDAADRRSRALDAMLAIYGEEFPSDVFFLYNEYRPGESTMWLVESKLRYLAYLPDLGRNRNGGADYLQDFAEEGNLPGIQKKVGLLLGIDHSVACRSLTDGILSRNILLRPDAEQNDVPGEPSGEMPVPQLPEGDTAANDELSIKNGPISRSMFVGGVKLENFVLVQRSNRVEVGFRKVAGAPLQPLAAREDERQAALFAHQFRNGIARLNRECEGMHIVEHLLLRPQGQGVIGHEDVDVPSDFYGNRISVILPGWTARFQHVGFRKALEETFCRNLAAHIFPEFYWLDFADMRVFEQYQHNWRARLQQRAQGDIDYDALNAAAEKIIVFLRMKQTDAERSYWV